MSANSGWVDVIYLDVTFNGRPSIHQLLIGPLEHQYLKVLQLLRVLKGRWDSVEAAQQARLHDLALIGGQVDVVRNNLDDLALFDQPAELREKPTPADPAVKMFTHTFFTKVFPAYT